MYILCIGYYDKFSRFFLGVKKELKKEVPHTKFNFLSVYTSGFLYSFLRFKSSSLITYKAWLHSYLFRKKHLVILKNGNCYKGIDINSLITYHLNLNKNVSKKKLQLQAISYIHLLDDKFLKSKPDFILSIGDSRLVFEVIKHLSKKHKIPIYYLEQGPFSSTFIDTKGANANASIRNTALNKLEKISKQDVDNILSYTRKLKSKPYKRSPFYRGLDYLITALFESSFLMPPDLKYIDSLSFNKFRKKSTSKVLYDRSKNVFLLLLQVPTDVNMIQHSPYFRNHYEIVKHVYENLPLSSQLILREHPVFIGSYKKELYAYAKKNNISFDNTSPLHESIKNSDVIIVNNSTVGIEAIAMKKVVVVLGNAYYDLPEICLKYKNIGLKALLTKSLNFKPNEDYIYLFLHKFISDNLINGFITDLDLKASKTIAKRILIAKEN